MGNLFCKLQLLFVLLIINSSLYAVDIVTLTTFGDGLTEKEAIYNALRSAIEQTFGAFMSSTTDIENDLLIKDEIVSVSSGNIHSYKVLGKSCREDGIYSVSCEVTVSLQKLHNYVISKGAQVEFSGNSFAANVQLEKLNKENEQKALEHLVVMLSQMNNLCDYDIRVEEPNLNEAYETGLCTVKGEVLLKVNENTINYGVLLYNTLASLNVADASRTDLVTVPNLGRFQLRNPLSSVLSNDLSEYEKGSYWSGGGIRYYSYPKEHYKNYLFFKKIWDFEIVEVKSNNSERLLSVLGRMSLSRDNDASEKAYNYSPYPCLPSAKKYVIYLNSFKQSHSTYFHGKMDLANVVDFYTATRASTYGTKVPVYTMSSWADRLVYPFIYPAYDGTYSGYEYDFFTVDNAKVGQVFAKVQFELNYDIEDIVNVSGFKVYPIKE